MDVSKLNLEIFLDNFFGSELRKGQGSEWAVLGGKGAGKSTVSISLAMKIDKNFTLDNVVYSSKQWTNRLSEVEKGSVLVWEELGTKNSMSSRRSMTLDNQETADILQTGRTEGVLTLLNFPIFQFFDVRGRYLAKGLIMPYDKIMLPNNNGGYWYYVKTKMEILEYNPLVNKVYKKYPSWYGHRIVSMDIPHPPKNLWDEYQKRRDEIPKTLIAEGKLTVAERLEAREEKKEATQQKYFDRMLKKVKKNPSAFLKKKSIDKKEWCAADLSTSKLAKIMPGRSTKEFIAYVTH